MNRKTKIILITGIILAGGGLLAWALSRWDVGLLCIFRWLTGLECPGCGNTRATLALLRLDFGAMLRYNLMYPLEIFYIAFVYLTACRNYVREGRFYYGTRRIKWDIAFLAVMLLWTVIRNLL